MKNSLFSAFVLLFATTTLAEANRPTAHSVSGAIGQTRPTTSAKAKKRFPRLHLEKNEQSRTRKTAERTAKVLRSLLEDLDYDSALRNYLGKFYREWVHFELARESFVGKGELLEALKQKNPYMKDRQRLALRFFYLGQKLSPTEMKQLLGRYSVSTPLLADLFELDVLEVTKEGFRLNDYSIQSQLLNDKTMYLVSDLPKELSPKGRSPETFLSSTSYKLMKNVLKELKGKNLNGVMADWGSGNGIQAIAALMTQPKLKAIGLEIEPQSMALSEFNALLNEVGPRFSVVDNLQPGQFEARLGNNKLVFASANPPFNPAPKSIGTKHIGTFAYGGPMGIKWHATAINQLLPKLDKDAKLMIYSEFVVDSHQKRLMDKFLRGQLSEKALKDAEVPALNSNLKKGLKANFLSLGKGLYADDYAEFVHDYVKNHAKPEDKASLPSLEAITQSYRKVDFNKTVPTILTLSHSKDSDKNSTTYESGSMPNLITPFGQGEGMVAGIPNQPGGRPLRALEGGVYLNKTERPLNILSIRKSLIANGIRAIATTPEEILQYLDTAAENDETQKSLREITNFAQRNDPIILSLGDDDKWKPLGTNPVSQALSVLLNEGGAPAEKMIKLLLKIQEGKN